MPVLPLVGSSTIPPLRSCPSAFSLVDHRQADPVLDRAARVEKLTLGPERRTRLFPVQLDLEERRVTNELEQASVNTRVIGEGGQS